jgi:hypothetical protein
MRLRALVARTVITAANLGAAGDEMEPHGFLGCWDSETQSEQMIKLEMSIGKNCEKAGNAKAGRQT